MEEKVREEGTLNQDNKKKKRFPIILCIMLLCCAVFGGLLVGGIIKVPTIGGLFVDVETAKILKQASNVKDELTLRELLFMITNNGTLTLGADTVVQKANRTSGNGGAIENTVGTAYLYGDFKYNNAPNGGAIRSDGGTIRIEGSLFEDNNATSSNGGAIAGTATFTIINSTFSKNDAVTNGGAMHNGGTAVTTIQGCTFESNNAGSGGTDAQGGGAIFSEGTLTVESYTPEEQEATIKTTFNDNTGKFRGGAIRFTGSSLSVTDAEFINNNAGVLGGAIHTTKQATVKNAVFTNNTASSHGGAVYTEKTITIIGGRFKENVAAKDGGAIYNTTGASNITDTYFEENVAARGGAIFTDGSGIKLTINGGEYRNNIATEGGGAILCATGTGHTITNVTMQGNKVDPAYTVEGFTLKNADRRFGGGAMLIGGIAQISLTDVTINGNSALYKDTDKENYASSDITFRDNSSSGTALLILKDSSFDGVVSWRPREATTSYLGKVQLDGAYDAKFTVCKAEYLTDEPIVSFGSTLTNEDIIKSAAKIEVRSDYASATEYETGKYCVANTTLTYTEEVEGEDGTSTEKTKTISGGMIRYTEEIIERTEEPTNYFASLSDSVIGAKAEDTVQIVKEAITVDSTISIAKTVTITNAEGSDVNIYRGTTSNVFAITGNLTIAKAENGSITIDGRTKANATKETPDTEGTSAENGLILVNGGKLTMNGVVIRYVKSTTNGGAVCVKNAGDVTVTGSTFSDNKALNGAAIWVDSSSASTVEVSGNSRFERNEATDAGGGAIYFNNSSANGATLTMKETVFEGNHSKTQDGAVQVGGSKTNFIVESCDFIGNYSAGDGGAVGVTSNTKKAEFKGIGKFQGNYTTGSGKAGGAINTNGSAISITG